MAISRRLLVFVVVGVLLAVTVGVGVYGLVRGPRHAASAPDAGAASSGSGGGSPAPSGSATATGQAPVVLLRTDDPRAYAKSVAAALFDWSTTSGYTAADYTSGVLADADPSGEEVPGLVGDVASYEPTTGQWAKLAALRVVQRLTITGAAVPSQWPEALAQAHGQLRPGTTAITITGTRHRSGIWYGQPASTSSPVAFTVFEACTPAFSRCHTLRLSELNDPLR